MAIYVQFYCLSNKILRRLAVNGGGKKNRSGTARVYRRFLSPPPPTTDDSTPRQTAARRTRLASVLITYRRVASMVSRTVAVIDDRVGDFVARVCVLKKNYLPKRNSITSRALLSILNSFFYRFARVNGVPLTVITRLIHNDSFRSGRPPVWWASRNIVKTVSIR